MTQICCDLLHKSKKVCYCPSARSPHTATLPHIGTNKLHSNVTGVKTTRANRASQKQKPTTTVDTKHILLRTWLSVLTAVSVSLYKMILCWRCKTLSVSPSHLFPFCVSALKREDKMKFAFWFVTWRKVENYRIFPDRGKTTADDASHPLFFHFFQATHPFHVMHTVQRSGCVCGLVENYIL